MNEETLADVLARCVPYHFPAPWKCLQADPAACLFTPQAAPRPLLGDEEAAAAGSGSVHEAIDRVDPPLPQPVLVVSDVLTDARRDVIMSAGCLLSSDIPLFEGLRDAYNMRALEKADYRLLVTADVEDALLLRAVGLPAVPAAGIVSLGQDHERTLAHLFGITRELSRREQDLDHEEPALETARQGCGLGSHFIRMDGRVGLGAPTVTITLVSWSVQSLNRDQPEPIRRVLDWFREMEQHRNWQLDEVVEWLPSAESVAKIRFALDKNSARWVKDAILDSLDESTVSLACGKPAVPPTLPPSVSQVMRELHDVLISTKSDDASRRQKRDALGRYQRVMYEQLIQPIWEALELSPSPRERMNLLQMATLAQLFLDKMPAVREEILAVSPVAGGVVRAPHQVRELLSVSQQLLQCFKDENGWQAAPRRPRTPTAAKSAHNSTNKSAGFMPRFANLGSINNN
jgi:hypothetical protein